MQILKSLYFLNVPKILFHEKVQKLRCFITNYFCELCEGWAPMNSCILKISPGTPIFSLLIVISIVQSIK